MRRMAMAAAAAAAAAMFTTGCGLHSGGGTGGTVGTPLTFEEAKVAATDLGDWMAPLVLSTDVEAEGKTLEQKRTLFAHVFGPKVSKSPTSGGDLFDGAFIFDMEQATTTTGNPTILMWSLSGGSAFFYEPTVIDVRTGGIYQGSFMGAEEGVEFFGPLMPPAATQIVGTFSLEEIGGIAESLYTGLQGEESPGLPE